MDTAPGPTIEPKTRSARMKKEIRKQPHGAVVKSKRRLNWATKEKQRANDQAVRLLQQNIRDQMTAKKEAEKTRAKERQQRREENQKKAEIVQVIQNSAKLKRIKKKQLRRIEKRDTLQMPVKSATMTTKKPVVEDN